MRFIPLFILLLPIAEIWSLIEVGSYIGVMPTIALLILSGMLGTQLLRRQGVSTLMKVNQKLAAGEMPTKEVVDGLLLSAAGILLIIPGFITDVIALICLFPLTRLLIRHLLVKQILAHPGMVQFNVTGFSMSPGDDKGQEANIYEGEYRDESTHKPRLPSE